MTASVDNAEVLAFLKRMPVPPPTFTFHTQTPAAKGEIPAVREGKATLINLNGEDLTVDAQTFKVRNFNHRPADTTTGAPATGGPEFNEHTVPAKNPEHLRSLAREILENDGGIVTVHEVIGRGDNPDASREALYDNAYKFVNQYLGGKYMVIAVAGNDPYGKNSIMLVRKDLPLEMEVQSRVGYRLEEDVGPYTTGKKVFSRSHEVVIFRVKGRKKPVLILSYNHNKSMYLNPAQATRPDAKGDLLREIQANVDAAVLLDFEGQEQFKGVPIISMGDRNDDIDVSHAYRGTRTFLTNSFNLFDVPKDKRTTDFYYGDGGVLTNSAIDSAMVNKAAQRPGLLTGVHVDSYTDDKGQAMVPPRMKPPPGTPSSTPSDHTPVVLEFDLNNLLRGN